MQFPLRDFFWLTVVIGLAVGIAMERARVRELSVHQGRAEWWQKAAHATAVRLKNATGETVQFDELKKLDIDVPAREQSVPVKGINGEVEETLRVKLPGYRTTDSIYARETRLRDLSWFTGMIDLDMYILLLIFGGPFLAMVVYRTRGKYPKIPIAFLDPNAPAWKQLRWFVPLWIPFCVAQSLFTYCFQQAPFTGALWLVHGVVWTYGYCQYIFTPHRQSSPRLKNGAQFNRVSSACK